MITDAMRLLDWADESTRAAPHPLRFAAIEKSTHNKSKNIPGRLQLMMILIGVPVSAGARGEAPDALRGEFGQRREKHAPTPQNFQSLVSLVRMD